MEPILEQDCPGIDSLSAPNVKSLAGQRWLKRFGDDWLFAAWPLLEHLFTLNVVLGSYQGSLRDKQDCELLTGRFVLKLLQIEEQEEEEEAEDLNALNRPQYNLYVPTDSTLPTTITIESLGKTDCYKSPADVAGNLENRY